MNSVAPLAMGAHSAQYSRHGSTPPTPSSQNGRYGNGLLSSQYNGANNTVDSVTLDVSKRIIGGRGKTNFLHRYLNKHLYRPMSKVSD